MGKYQGYERYKDSGIEWLGEIPEHWKHASLRWISQRYAGGTPDKKKSEYWEDGDIPWVNSGAVNQQIITEPSQYITREGFSKSSAKWIPIDALVMALAGQGKTKGMVAQTKIRVTCNQSMAAIVFNKEKNSRYLFWWLTSRYKQIRGLTSDEGRDGLNLEMIGSIPCPLPPLEEQDAIAQFLDHKTSQIDALISKKEALLQKLDEKRTALISHAVTKGLDPTVPMKDSGIEWLGDIPAHWDTRYVKRVADISYGVGGEIDRGLTEGINLLSLPNVTKNGNLLVDEFCFCELDESEKTGVILQKGDLLFNWRNGSSSHLGKTAYFDLDGEWTHVSFLLRLRFDMSRFCSRYFQYMLNGLRITGFFRVSKAGVNNTFNLNELSNLKVICPPQLEQEKVAQFLDHKTSEIDQQKAKIKQAIDLLKEYRTALITNAVTGKIDVRQVPIPQP